MTMENSSLPIICWITKKKRKEKEKGNVLESSLHSHEKVLPEIHTILSDAFYHNNTMNRLPLKTFKLNYKISIVYG